MVAQAIIQRLQLLGLEPDEASVYVHLQLLGPSKAAQVAAAADLPRAHAYRALDRLVGLGFVTASLSRPAVFSAEPPGRVFQALLASTESRRKNIVLAEGEVMAAFASVLARPAQAPPRPKFGIIEGRDAIIERATEMENRATQDIRLLLSFDGVDRVLENNGTLARLQQRAEAGLSVQAVFGEAARPMVEKARPTKGLELRLMTDPGPLGFLIVDRASVLSLAAGSMAHRSGPRIPIAVATDAEALVAVITRLFDIEWQRAAPAVVGHDPSRRSSAPA